MSKVKHRDRKQKTTARADHDVHGDKSPKLEMQGEVASLMPAAVASAPAARKKERRYGHN